MTHAEVSAVRAASEVPTLHVLHLFGGPAQQSGIQAALASLVDPREAAGLHVDSLDLRGTPPVDVCSEASRSELLRGLRAGRWACVLLSPPSASWSRAQWRGSGPCPVRSAEWPWGFPWAGRAAQERADAGNNQIQLVLAMLTGIRALRTSPWFVLSHPEDMGITDRGRPASIWQLDELRELASTIPGAFTVCFFQCAFDAPRARPTRLLTNVPGLRQWGATEWPLFDNRGCYLGPLPSRCGHDHSVQSGSPAPRRWASAADAGEPPRMSQELAVELLEAYRGTSSPASQGVAGVAESAETKVSPNVVAQRVGLLELARPWPANHVYIGREDTRRGLRASPVHNPFRISSGLTRDEAVTKFRDLFLGRVDLQEYARQHLKGKTLVCRCRRQDLCHGDTILEWLAQDAGSRVSCSAEAQAVAASAVAPLATGAARVPQLSGRGRPVGVAKKGIMRDMEDGAGLCSPGRFHPSHRSLSSVPFLECVRDEAQKSLETWFDREGLDSSKLLAQIACGRCAVSPFPGDLVEGVREFLTERLMVAGYSPAARKGDRQQPIRVRLLEALGRACGDPDADIGALAAEGVPIGFNEPLPRLPEVFEQKTAWPLDDLTGDETMHWADNHPSAKDRPDILRKHFEQDVQTGLMLKLSEEEARQRFGGRLSVAACGLVAKPGSEDFRVIFDASNRVFLNHRIRVQDRLRLPTVGDIKAVLREVAMEGGPRFMLFFDVAQAHRQVRVVERDWGLLACKISSGDPFLFVNCVGTFGVASAGYWWGRLAGLFMRLLHHFLGPQYAIWALLYADDGALIGRGVNFSKSLILAMLFLEVVGVPLSWRKTRGGLRGEWIGYLVDTDMFTVGISPKRAAWVDGWLSDALRVGKVYIRDLRSVLGRLTFVAGAVESLKPFLGPIFAWASAAPRGGFVEIPKSLVAVFTFIRDAARGNLTTPCARPVMNLGEVFRADAKAEDGLVVVGGWRVPPNGRTEEAAWFSLELGPADVPWAYAKDGKPNRAIASLELLASLLCVMLLIPPSECLSVDTTATLAITGATDNQGNAFLLDRFMTTKWPLSLVLIETAAQLHVRNLALRLDWVNRGNNQPADDLTNFVYEKFDMRRRVPVKWEELKFEFLNGAAALQAESPGAAREDAERPAQVPLRLREPW